MVRQRKLDPGVELELKILADVLAKQVKCRRAGQGKYRGDCTHAAKVGIAKVANAKENDFLRRKGDAKGRAASENRSQLPKCTQRFSQSTGGHLPKREDTRGLADKIPSPKLTAALTEWERSGDERTRTDKPVECEPCFDSWPTHRAVPRFRRP